MIAIIRRRDPRNTSGLYNCHSRYTLSAGFARLLHLIRSWLKKSPPATVHLRPLPSRRAKRYFSAMYRGRRYPRLQLSIQTFFFIDIHYKIFAAQLNSTRIKTLTPFGTNIHATQSVSDSRSLTSRGLLVELWRSRASRIRQNRENHRSLQCRIVILCAYISAALNVCPHTLYTSNYSVHYTLQWFVTSHPPFCDTSGTVS